MPPYKDPSFTDRTRAAAEAKQKALDQLRAKPPLSDEEKAARLARQEAKAAAEAEKRAAKAAAEAEAKAAREAAEEQARAEKAAKMVALPSAAELKAARDARYAARKARSK